MTEFPRMPYIRPPLDDEDALQIAAQELETARLRRSIRAFAPTPTPPRELIESALRIACMAPSGANRQPWRFVVISDPETKHAIRLAAEAEEREFYEHRASAEWLEALAPLGTDWEKPFLDDAPYLIVVFRVNAEPDGENFRKNYYVPESVGIAVGMLIHALNRFGLSTLTHTPAPMGFLNEICGRPLQEKPFVLMPVGYPADGCTVPDLPRKPFEEMVIWRE
jgi:iodotyrosine deiodinase